MPASRRPPTAADGPAGSGGDSQLDSAWTDSTLLVEPANDRVTSARRLNRLAVVTVLVALAVMAYAAQLAQWPTLPLAWRGDAAWVVDDPASADAGRIVRALGGGENPAQAADIGLRPRSARWIAGDTQRRELLERQDRYSVLFDAAQVRAEGADGRVFVLPVTRGSVAGLGIGCWLLLAAVAALAIAASMIVNTVRTPAAAMTLSIVGAQALHLGLSAAEVAPLAAWPTGFGAIDLMLRSGVDLASAAAFVCACMLARRPLVADPVRLAAPWIVAIALLAGIAGGFVPFAWWLTQAAMLAAIGFGIWWLRPRPGSEPRPYAALLRRLSIAALAALALLTVAVAAADGVPAVHLLRVAAPIAFTGFTVTLLLLVPVALRAHAVFREAALLAGACTLAASLHLLLAARGGIGPDAALSVSVVAAAMVYLAARRGALACIVGRSSSASGEQMFESLYRAARDIEREPAQAAAHLRRLLRELFEPLEIGPHAGPALRARVSPDGSTLVVPLPRLPDVDTGADAALRLRLARRGNRLFTREDARLAERVMEQLRRAVTFDHAVEQGRTEERMRIAQDLHDDIGARLLTLMYQARDPEMEDYLRHTLQDLKTLTRGLAASSHPLSDAAAEWKADLTQRLAATNCAITWSFVIDRDFVLSVTQWSALTRILRELVNNIIAHAQASEVEIIGSCDRGRLVLQVSDDGVGRQPESWSHGLGLGGVRKRVKALGGQVTWHERPERGIRCELHVLLRPNRR